MCSQSALNAAFADDGELLFVGSAERENVYGAERLGAEENGQSAAAARPGSESRQRPGSARRGIR